MYYGELISPDCVSVNTKEHEAFLDELIKTDEEIQKLLKELPEREAEILTMRYGLDDGVPKTLDEVGKKFSTVLEHAGVFKRDEKGIKAFNKFINSL